MNDSDVGKLVVKMIGAVLGFIILLVILFGTFGNINAGEQGVLLEFGAVKGTLDEGIYAKIPIIQQVKRLNVRM